MVLRDHIDKVGMLGAAFAAVCCLGIPAVLSVVTAIGLGFLIHDALLLPLLALSLGVTLWGLASGWRRHHHSSALVVAGIASAGLVAFTFVRTSRPLALVCIGLLVGASILNIVLLRRGRAIEQPA
ncbi:MAG TPA: MerC domain-containing protein [Thermoanaerobaculia bacterium]|jgi:mercuric ion transport protein|nr:MerC domain-containing protein [Thermoanaerobaculia bacterium]